MGGETNATAGFTSVGLDGTGANKFESQDSVKNVGEFALHADANDTPTAGARFYKDIQTDMSISNGDVVRLEIHARHIGTGLFWMIQLGSADNGGVNVVKSIQTSDTTFEPIIYYWTHDASYRYLVFKEVTTSNNGGIYADNISVKKVTFV